MTFTPDQLSTLQSGFEFARAGDVEALRAFLHDDGPVNLTNSRGDTLLILATYHRQDDVVALLLAARADVNRVNDNGQTALGSAVFRNSAHLVRALLAAGADPDLGARSARVVGTFFALPQMLALLPDPVTRVPRR